MQITAFVATSVDGFIARRDGDIDWLHDPVHTDANEDYGYRKLMSSIDALVMGRRTFEKVLSFDDWPYGETPVIVLTRNDVEVPSRVGDRVETMSPSPCEVVAALEARGHRHLYVDGGQTIQGFLAAGLVTDLIITRIPRLLGTGIPLFGMLERDIRLRHVKTTAYPKGLVTSHYAVAND